jgi:hypothetical protein
MYEEDEGGGEVIFYANMRKSDGFFLPSGRGRGFTHDVPTPFYEKPPRLFVKKCAAQAALRCWLKGGWIQANGPLNEDGEWDVWSEPPPQAPLDRRVEDWETVTIKLTEPIRLEL